MKFRLQLEIGHGFIEKDETVYNLEDAVKMYGIMRKSVQDSKFPWAIYVTRPVRDNIPIPPKMLYKFNKLVQAATITTMPGNITTRARQGRKITQRDKMVF